MPDTNITQVEAEALIEMEKYRVENRQWRYPDMGGSIHIPLTSADKREDFHLDITRGRIDFAKVTYQNRTHIVIPLVRLDLGSAPHRNPDDTEVLRPHLHIYREGYADRWAMPVPAEYFTNTNDLMQTLAEFMRYCHIVGVPDIVGGLWV